MYILMTTTNGILSSVESRSLQYMARHQLSFQEWNIPLLETKHPKTVGVPLPKECLLAL